MRFNKQKVLLTMIATQAIVCDLSFEATGAEEIKFKETNVSDYRNVAEKLVRMDCAIRMNNAIAKNSNAWYAQNRYRDSVVNQITEAIIKKISGMLYNQYAKKNDDSEEILVTEDDSDDKKPKIEKEEIITFYNTDIKKYTRSNYNALVLYNFIDKCDNKNKITEKYINECINARVKAIKEIYKDDINESTLEAAVHDVKEYLKIPGVIEMLQTHLKVLPKSEEEIDERRFTLWQLGKGVIKNNRVATYVPTQLWLNNNITANISITIRQDTNNYVHISPESTKDKTQYLKIKLNGMNITDMRANMMPEEYEKIMYGLRSILSSELRIDTTAITDYINWGKHPNKEYEGKLITINALEDIDTKYLDKPEEPLEKPKEPLEEEENTFVISEEKGQYSYKDYEDTYKEYEYTKIPNDLKITEPKELKDIIVSDDDE